MRKLRLSRFHGFLLGSAALIGVAVVVSGLTVGSFFERHVLAHEEEHAAKVVQTQAVQHLAPADFDLSRSSDKGDVFKAFLRELTGVFRIKVYDRTGRIVWSDEPRLIGMVFADNTYLAEALKGKVTTVHEAPKRSEHIYERTKGSVAEVYVPITFAPSPGVVGVIETYGDITESTLWVRRTQRLIWGVTGGMGLFLYAGLALIVWSAARLEESHAALLAKTKELEQANETLRETQAQLVEQERLAAAGQVVVGLHHAILNPLTGILGALQVLKPEGMAPTAKAEAFAQAEAEIRKIEQLIRRLPTLRRATGTPYVGDTTMLDLERSCAEEKKA